MTLLIPFFTEAERNSAEPELRDEMERVLEKIRVFNARYSSEFKHRLRKREDRTRNFRSFILRPISSQFISMTVAHFLGI
jgi:hypothetical protein